MPEVQYTTTMALPLPEVWDFVRDMNNWAPFITGYQSHEIESDADSIWTLKGDVGILSRVVRVGVHIDEWIDEERVAFSLKGLTEPMEGGGIFTIRTLTGDAPAPAVSEVPAPPKRGFFARIWERIVRFFYRKAAGTAVERAPQAPAATDQGSELTFHLSMDAQGPTGPLVNAMITPMLQPFAEDLANKIAHALETRQSAAA